MSNKTRLTFFSLLLIAGFSQQVVAQQSSKPVNDTLETFFHNEPHKDGFELRGQIVEIPEAIAKKCDQKTIRITGKHSYAKAMYDAEHPEDSTEIRQGRYEYVPTVDDSGRIKSERRFASTGSTFIVASISTWNKAKKRWELVFVNK